MKAIYNIPYGVYVLTAKGTKQNGCIINTLCQVTSSPCKISITVNKDNYTTQLIEKTGEFNVSILDVTTGFDIVKHFGFQSGKDVDKFAGVDCAQAKNHNVTCKGCKCGTLCAKFWDKDKVECNVGHRTCHHCGKVETTAFFHHIYTCHKGGEAGKYCSHNQHRHKLPRIKVCAVCQQADKRFTQQDNACTADKYNALICFENIGEETACVFFATFLNCGNLPRFKEDCGKHVDDTWQFVADIVDTVYCVAAEIGNKVTVTNVCNPPCNACRDKWQAVFKHFLCHSLVQLGDVKVSPGRRYNAEENHT